MSKINWAEWAEKLEKIMADPAYTSCLQKCTVKSFEDLLTDCPELSEFAALTIHAPADVVIDTDSFVQFMRFLPIVPLRDFYLNVYQGNIQLHQFLGEGLRQSLVFDTCVHFKLSERHGVQYDFVSNGRLHIRHNGDLAQIERFLN